MNLLDPGLVGSGPTGAPDILWMYVNVFLCIENFSLENFYSLLAGPTGLRAISDATENQITGFQNTMLGQILLCLLLCFLVLLFQSTDFSQFSYKKERGTEPWNKLE